MPPTIARDVPIKNPYTIVDTAIETNSIPTECGFGLIVFMTKKAAAKLIPRALSGLQS